VDTNKYSTGLRTCRNTLIQRHGGASNRPGGEWVCEVASSQIPVRLIQFVFNADQTYVLEFGTNYMRVIRDGALLTNTAKNITAITKASPGVITITGHGYSNGDELYVSGIVGMTQLNNRYALVANRTTDTFTLVDKDGNAINTTSYTTYSSGGTVAKIYAIVTPYQYTDLSSLKFVQSADVMTIVHKDYPPYELARTGHTSWTLTKITFAPGQAAPTNLAASGGTGGGVKYQVTAISSDSLEESLPASLSYGNQPASASPVTFTWDTAPGAVTYYIYRQVAYSDICGFIGASTTGSFTDNAISPDANATPPTARDPFALETAKAISGITAANPAVVTTATHGYSTDDVIYISGVTGMTEVNSLFYKVTALSNTTFSLRDMSGAAVDSSAYTAYSSGGNAQRAHNYPSCVGYIQQRLVLGNSKLNPEGIWMSRSGQYKNFTRYIPLQSDDSITARITGKQVNAIEHIVDAGKPLILTQAGEHALLGDSGGTITPTEINPRQFTYNGSSSLPPVVIDGDVVYVQKNGSLIIDMAFSFESDGYKGNELSLFSAHLVDGHEIVDIAYQKTPNSILWAVRDDGVLLGLTYVKDQMIAAWHRHDFDTEEGVLNGSAYAGGGTAFRGVERICVVPEDGEDSVYLVVKRTVNGYVKRYIERMKSRNFSGKTVSAIFKSDIKDAPFLDCAGVLDGRNTSAALTMTISGGTNWTYNETLTLTASSSYFASTDVNKQIHIEGADGTVLRFTIKAYTSGTVVTGRCLSQTVPAAMRSTAFSKWGKAVNQVTGIWHLNGETVGVFADGFEVANPNRSSMTAITVATGAVTLPGYYTFIRVGIPYISDIELLNIDTANGETLIDKNKCIGEVTLMLESTRGLWVGGKPPTDDDDDPLEGLTELKLPDSTVLDGPPPLFTGEVRQNLQGEWNSNGRIFIRQIGPYPFKVLTVAPSGIIPIGG